MIRAGICLCSLIVLAAGMAAWAAPSPYAGEQGRSIKALSAQEIEDLKAGRGMGLAKAGELNSYPGPSHVLALQAELGLDKPQLAATQALFDTMQSQAKQLGGEILEYEQVLDRAFAAGTIDPASLARLTNEIALLQGRLRATHLAAHLAMKELLTAQQVAAYDRLRGYGGNSDSKPAHDGHKH